MEGSDRALGGVGQRNRQLGALPRNRRTGDRDENVQRRADRVFTVDAPRDHDRKRPGELDRGSGDLLVEAVAFRSRLAADNQKPVALFRFGGQRFTGWVLDPSGDLDRTSPRLGRTGLVAGSDAAIDDLSRALGLFRPIGFRRRIVKMDHGRGNPSGSGEQAGELRGKLPTRSLSE